MIIVSVDKENPIASHFVFLVVGEGWRRYLGDWRTFADTNLLKRIQPVDSARESGACHDLYAAQKEFASHEIISFQRSTLLAVTRAQGSNALNRNSFSAVAGGGEIPMDKGREPLSREIVLNRTARHTLDARPTPNDTVLLYWDHEETTRSDLSFCASLWARGLLAKVVLLRPPHAILPFTAPPKRRPKTTIQAFARQHRVHSKRRPSL